MKEYFLGDRELYYRKNDFIEDRLTLVFVHGATGSSSAWLPYEKIFENKYNVLVYDIRGHGKSKKYPHYEDYEIKKFSYELHNLITYLNISKFVLISNSFGGLVALEYIKLWRDTVVANIFTSPEVYFTEGFLAKISEPILKVITGVLDFLPFNPKPRGHVDYSKHINSTDWDIKRNFADMRNTGLRAHFYSLRQSLARGQEYLFEDINVPTLIIHGEKDTMVPLKNSLLMAKKIKNADFISIPEIDHNTAHNAVGEMSGAIEEFVKKLTITN